MRVAPRAGGRIAPTEDASRITSLDAVRGIAVLGILTMNAVAFGLGDAAYFNLSASDPQSPIDWLVGVGGEVFFDQKFMALFSMLFGAGVVLFAERVAANGGRAVTLSLWRNFLLLLIGLVHSMIWDGDILVIYAICSPIVLAARRLRIRWLLLVGGLTLTISAILAAATQTSLSSTGGGLGAYWGVTGAMSDPVSIWLTLDIWLRALGAMLIGVALYRTGFLTGEADIRTYRRTAALGLALGIPLSALGVVYVAAGGFAPSTALVGTIPNTLATIPIALAYAALIILWHAAHHGQPFDTRIRDVGRMALTNYLAQTAIAVIVLQGILGDLTLSRSVLLLFAMMTAALQLWWSEAWLSRFLFGPAEWVWRAATYRRIP